MEETKEEVFRNVRACLLPFKGGLSVDKIDYEYYDMIGEHIPFRRFHSSCLNEFLDQIPRIKKVNKDNKLFFQVIPNENTAHLVNLVQGQKNPKTYPKKASPYYTNQSYHRNQTRYPLARMTNNIPSTSGHMINSSSKVNERPNYSRIINVGPRTETSSSQSNLKDSKVEEQTPVLKTVNLSEVPSNSSYLQEKSIPPDSMVDQFLKNTQETEQEKLVLLIAKLKLSSPVFKIWFYTSGCVYAQVKIGNEKYNSYPADAKNEWVAQLIVISKALTDLKEKHAPVEFPVKKDPYGIFTVPFFKYFSVFFLILILIMFRW